MRINIWGSFCPTGTCQSRRRIALLIAPHGRKYKNRPLVTPQHFALGYRKTEAKNRAKQRYMN